MFNLTSKTGMFATALSLSLLCSGHLFAEGGDPAYTPSYGPGPFYSYTSSEVSEVAAAPAPAPSTGNNSWSGVRYPTQKEKDGVIDEKPSDPPAATEPRTTNLYGPFYTYPGSDSQKKITAEAPKPKKKCPKIKPILEVKAGYFFFTDHKLKKIYNQEGLDLQIAASYPLWCWFQIYLSAEYFQKQGRSIGCHERTRVWGWPVSLGIKTVATISPKAQYYFTIGPRYFYFHVHNNSSHVDRELNHSAVGGFIGTGFNIFPMKHFVIDIFGEYSYCRTHFHAHKHNTYGEERQIGGFTFGGGLGYAF